MISEHKFINLEDGTELHAQLREKGHETWLVATHGIGEHLERHGYLNELFSHEFNICQYDLRGHGRSAGERAYVENFSVFMRDLDQIILFLKDHYKMKRFILFGHSMGALISASYLQNYARKDLYPERVFLSAPPIGFGGKMGELLRFTPKEVLGPLTKLPLSVQLSGLVDLNNLSHNPSIREDYLNDERNCLSLHTKLILEMVKESKDVFSRPLRPNCPTFCAFGSRDRIISVPQALNYFKETEKAVTYKVIEGAFHELHNEIKKYRGPYFEFLKTSIRESLYNISL